MYIYGISECILLYTFFSISIEIECYCVIKSHKNQWLIKQNTEVIIRNIGLVNTIDDVWISIKAALKLFSTNYESQSFSKRFLVQILKKLISHFFISN